MKPFVIKGGCPLKGKLNLLGDKSIAHRAVIASALSHQTTRIENFPIHNDSLATVNVLRTLGVKIYLNHPAKDDTATLTVYGAGLFGLKKPSQPVYFRESGTTFRLMMGVLAAQHFETRMTADRSLSRRPMKRVALPLTLMGRRSRRG
jgi:3-phosphoshikimate 1-carboxyvinyltransferase